MSINPMPERLIGPGRPGAVGPCHGVPAREGSGPSGATRMLANFFTRFQVGRQLASGCPPFTRSRAVLLGNYSTATDGTAGDMRVVSVGLGQMGFPLHGRIADKHPLTAWDLADGAADRFAKQWDCATAVSSDDDLCEAVTKAHVITTCLPNTNCVKDTWERIRCVPTGSHSRSRRGRGASCVPG